MDLSKVNRRMWMRRKLFVLSPAIFTTILVLQQIFDLSSTLYLTSFPNGEEINPILAPLWSAPGGVAWLISAKLWMCVLIGLGVPHVIKEAPQMIWSLKILCFFYWLIVMWNGYLVASTML